MIGQGGLGYGAEISGGAVQVMEFGFRLPGECGNCLPEQRASGAESRLFVGRERASGEEERGAGRVFLRKRLQIFGDERGLLEFLGGGGNSVGGCSEGEHFLNLRFLGPWCARLRLKPRRARRRTKERRTILTAENAHAQSS